MSVDKYYNTQKSSSPKTWTVLKKISEWSSLESHYLIFKIIGVVINQKMK